MEFDLVQLIKEVGLPVALVIYFAYKDFRFTARIVELMTRVDTMLERIQLSDRKGDAA